MGVLSSPMSGTILKNRMRKKSQGKKGKEKGTATGCSTYISGRPLGVTFEHRAENFVKFLCSVRPVRRDTVFVFVFVLLSFEKKKKKKKEGEDLSSKSS